jgi:uncharacterized RDD family membrane protein YckC
MENLDAPTPSVQYAGFWLRFLAYIIDALILGVVEMIVFLIFVGSTGLKTMMSLKQSGDMQDEEAIAATAAMMSSFIAIWLLIFIIQWLYFALMESSVGQATLGKKALGIQVTDIQGNKISFARATGRFFGKIISGMILFIGYIMAGFTSKKQALHDMMADTLVVKK